MITVSKAPLFLSPCSVFQGLDFIGPSALCGPRVASGSWTVRLPIVVSRRGQWCSGEPAPWGWQGQP